MKFFHKREGLLFIIVAILSIASCIFFFIQFPDKKITTVEDLEKEDFSIGGKFYITNYDEQNLSSEDLEGTMTIMYFGTLSCKQVCPSVIKKISDIHNALNQKNIKTHIVFVTLNSSKSSNISLNTLKSDLLKINPKFILIAPPNEFEVKQLTNLFRVLHFTSSREGIGDSILGHSAYIYILNKKAQYVKHFSHDIDSNEIYRFLLSQDAT